MLFRLLLILMFIFLLALAGLWVARILFFRWLSKKIGPAMQQQPRQPQNKEQIDVLVPCKQCGTFIPKHQAVQKEQDYYCRDHA